MKRPPELIEERQAFAASIEPRRARWEYCLSRVKYDYYSKIYGDWSECLNERTFPVCDRILGIYKGSSAYRLRQMRLKGFDAAEADWQARRYAEDKEHFFWCTALDPWLIGHVYFAHVEAFPHVLKVGFSRRVDERIEDVQSRCKERLIVTDLKVGTLADEHFWHKAMEANRIEGEWFFDPASTERSLPAFLQKAEAA